MKAYTVTCPACNEVRTIETRRKPPTTEVYCDRLACVAAYNVTAREYAAATRARRAQSARDRRLRAAKVQPVGDGSWAFIGALNGLKWD